MHNRIVFLGLFVSISALLSVANAAPPEEVGPLASPDRLIVEGTGRLPAEALKSALTSDPELLWLGHPLAPRREYVSAIRQRAELGLRHAGFSDPRVDARIEERTSDSHATACERLVVRVTEGARYKAGGIRVVGAPPELARLVEQRIRDSSPPENSLLAVVDLPSGGTASRWQTADGRTAEMQDPLWKTGEPAPFDAPTRERLRKQVARVLAEKGHDAARLRLDVIKSPSNGAANLQVQILALGPAAVVREIELSDGPKNKREAVLRFLALAEGGKVTELDRVAWDQRLRASGRFMRHQVTMQRRFGGDGMKVRFELEEYPHAPPLDKPLSREETALLRCRDWLVRMDEHGYDLLLERTARRDGPNHVSGEIVLSPNQGILVTSPAGSVDATALCAAANMLGCYLPGDAGKLEIPLRSSAQLTGSLELVLNDGPERAQHPFKLQFGAGIRSLEAGQTASPFQLQLRFDPVLFLATAHERSPEYQWNEQVLTIRSREGLVRIDAKSGRLLEISADDESGRWRLATEQGTFAKRFALLRARRGENGFRATQPISSMVEFFCSDNALNELANVWPQTNAETSAKIRALGPTLVRIVRRCAAEGAFTKLDVAAAEALAGGRAAPRETVTIPSSNGGSRPDEPMRLAAGYLMQVADQLFEREAWPSTLLRAAAGMAAGENKYTQYDLMRLYSSDQVGPLGFLTTSSVVPVPILAATFAQRGRDRLSVDDFRRDYQVLLQPLERWNGTQAIVAALRNLREDEAVAIGDALLGDGQLLVRLVQLLKSPPAPQQAVAAFPQSLDAWWEQGLRAHVEQHLRRRSSLDTAQLPQETK